MPLLLHVNWPECGQVQARVSDRLVNRVLPEGCQNNRWLTRWGNTVHVHAFSRANVVPDVDRYRLTRSAPPDTQLVCSRDGWFLTKHPPSCVPWSPCHDRFAAPAYGHRNATVVVLLESPHKDEYRNQNIMQPMAPAVKTTGQKINEALLAMLLDNAGALINDDTRIVIANPVPFQTSLHSIYDRAGQNKYTQTRIRNETWKALWSFCPIRAAFEARMRKYRPSVVVNACTRHLRPLVSHAVARLDIGVLFETAHPCVPGAWTEGNHLMTEFSSHR